VAPFDKLEVRQALWYAINRQQILDVAMSGLAEMPTDLLPSWHWGHDASYPQPENNADKAKELLAKAGYDASHPLSVRAADHQQRRLRRPGDADPGPTCRQSA
jgi:ABC-type transport system substrate-binding protein